MTAPDPDDYVLIVDDDPDAIEVLDRILKALGFDTRSASDGLQALQLIQDQHPMMVLLDLLMPEINGYAVLAQIKTDPQTKEIPVVLVTAYPPSDEQAATLQVEEIIRKGEFTVASIAQATASLPRATSEAPAVITPSPDRIDLLHPMANPCHLCGRTDNPLLEVATAAEIVDIFGLSDALVRASARAEWIPTRRSGNTWLLRYVEARARWSPEGTPPPAFRYWQAPDIPCPVCKRIGDPLDEVITIGEAIKHYAVSAALIRQSLVAGTIKGRKAKGVWLLLKTNLRQKWGDRLKS